MSDRYKRIGTSPHVNAPAVVLHACGDCGCAVIDKAANDAACPGEVRDLPGTTGGEG